MSTTKITYKEAKQRLTSEVLRNLRKIKDKDIDYSEIPKLDEQFWKNAKPLGRPKKAVCKELINLRLENFTLTALRQTGKGWQTRLSHYIDNGVKTGELLRH